MKLRTILLSLASCCLWTAFAQTPVGIENPNFAADELFCASCYYPAITGWTVGPNTGVQKNSAGDFPGSLPGGSPNFAYVGNLNSTGSIMQILGATVRANRTYTLKMSVGQQLGIALTGYIAGLMADSVILASDTTLRPAPGTFLEETIVYNSGPAPPQVGRPLVIFVKSVGNGQVDIANVSLTVQ